FGNNFEAGLGIGFQQRSVPSVYQDVVNSDGSEIEQTLKLRVIPFSATVRFLPLGRHTAIEPYIGAGVGVFRFHYSETGQWVDRRVRPGPTRGSAPTCHFLSRTRRVNPEPAEFLLRVLRGGVFISPTQL